MKWTVGHTIMAICGWAVACAVWGVLASHNVMSEHAEWVSGLVILGPGVLVTVILTVIMAVQRIATLVKWLRRGCS